MTDNSPLVRRVQSIVPLNEQERAELAGLPMSVREYGAHEAIVHEGDRPTSCCLLLDGIIVRQKTTISGRRQILAVHVPGDIPDLQSLHLKVMDHSLIALTAVKAGFIAHEQLRSLMKLHQRFVSVFWQETLIDAAIFREWLINLGRRSALERLAHFFCEHYVKLSAVELAANYNCAMPLTQSDLADAIGVTNVHLNRSLQDLRKRNLIKLDRRRLAILQWDELRKLADFSPVYLHLDPLGNN